MSIFLGHESAFELLDIADKRPGMVSLPASVDDLTKFAVAPDAFDSANDGEVCDTALGGLILSDPVHLIVSDTEMRRPSNGKACHVWSGKVPGSYLPISLGKSRKDKVGLFVSSPEALFLQMASRLDVIDLAYFGSYLCSEFAYVDDGNHGFRSRDALASPQLMESYLDKASGLKGIRRARQVVKYLVGDAASPMELKIALMLSLPGRYGGFGLPKPVLNYEVEPDSVHKGLTSQNFYKLDICWPAQKVSMEYDSRAFHSDENSAFHDARRANEIEALGFRVMTLRARQVMDSREFGKVVKQVRALLNCRRDSAVANVDERRRLLRERFMEQGLWVERFYSD